MGRRVNDLSGKRFGRLVAVECVGVKNKGARWLCKCDCGKSVVVYATNLTSSNKPTNSCGCLAKEAAAMRRTAAYDNRRLYGVWASMIQRCVNNKTINYRYYGARGISVCKKWTDSFDEFKRWAIANGYTDYTKRCACTIDRIYVDGNYEPANCRWVDAKAQANNRRKRGTLSCKS